MAVKILSAVTNGIKSEPIHVEVDLMPGLPTWHIVGLGDMAVKESIERIKSAIHHCQVRLPMKRIIVNLAPAELRKHGTALDLPIAIGVLASAKCIPANAVRQALFIGELSLDGSVKPIRGIISILLYARSKGIKQVYIPFENISDAQLIPDLTIYPVRSLQELIAYAAGGSVIAPMQYRRDAAPAYGDGAYLATIIGVEAAKRALQIAAVGRHHILFVGPPGVGKTMLSRGIVELLPPLTYDEMLEVNAVHSLTYHRDAHGQLITKRPFQEVHHTITIRALIGGGAPFQPGAISLAHHGVLFLDELAEFPRESIEVLRTPLESGQIIIQRAAYRMTLPARSICIAAMNPCPCGWSGSQMQMCSCSPADIFRYRKKISGPILDRIDLLVRIGSVRYDQSKSSLADAQNMILTTQNAIAFRAARSTSSLRSSVQSFNPAALLLLSRAAEKLHCSLRVHHRLIEIARTIADLEKSETVFEAHVLEALQYRQNVWN